MFVEIGDYMLVMKFKEEWMLVSSCKEMFEKIEELLSSILGIGYEFF